MEEHDTLVGSTSDAMEITSLFSIFINCGGPVWLDTGFGIRSCGDYLILSFPLLDPQP
jgi:hypothetical protein